MTQKSSEQFQYVQSIAELFGLWSDNYSLKYHVCRMTTTIVYILLNCSSFFGLYREIKRGSLDEICSNIALLLIGIFASTTIMLQRREESRQMISALFCNERVLYNHPNEILRKFYRTTIKEIWPTKLFIILRWSIYSAVVVFFISIFIHVHETQKNAEECIENPKCSFVFMNYYHLPWNERKYYWAANIQNVSFGAICGIFAYYRDVYISGFIIFLRCKLRMLSYVIGHLNEFVYDSDLKHYDWLLKECVKEHQRITREFIYLRGKLYMILLFMLIVDTPAIVNTAIIIVQGAEINPFTIFICCSAMYGCSHILLFLWLAEELSYDSTQVGESIYFSQWYKLEVNQQKLLHITLIRAQCPFTLTCGPFFSANLSTFAKTMRTVYTFVNAYSNLSK